MNSLYTNEKQASLVRKLVATWGSISRVSREAGVEAASLSRCLSCGRVLSPENIERLRSLARESLCRLPQEDRAVLVRLERQYGSLGVLGRLTGVSEEEIANARYVPMQLCEVAAVREEPGEYLRRARVRARQLSGTTLHWKGKEVQDVPDSE